MSALVIDSIVFPVADGGEGKPVFVGDRSRTYNGGSRNTTRNEKRTFSVTSPPVAASLWQSLRAATRLQKAVPVTGDIMSGDSLTMYVDITAKGVLGTNPLKYIMTASGEEQ